MEIMLRERRLGERPDCEGKTERVSYIVCKKNEAADQWDALKLERQACMSHSSHPPCQDALLTLRGQSYFNFTCILSHSYSTGTARTFGAVC